MKAKRYKLTSESSLTDLTTQKSYVFKKVRAERKGRITVLHFRLQDGSDISAASYSVDTNGYDLGIGEVTASPKKAGESTKLERIPVPGIPVIGIVISRDELLQIHGALQSAADVTLRKIVDSLR